MAFGISGSPTTNRMVGGDVVVAGVDQSTISGFAQDYYLLDKSQCIVQQETGQVSGSCPDSNIQVSTRGNYFKYENTYMATISLLSKRTLFDLSNTSRIL
jgi:hypothetical protein